MVLTKYNLADELNGREYPDIFPREDFLDDLRAENLVVVYASSDDLVEFDGSIYEEFSERETIYVKNDGIPHNMCPEGPDCPNWKNTARFWVKGLFGISGAEATWVFDTNIPTPAYFTIMEDGEPFIKGFIFCLDDLE